MLLRTLVASSAFLLCCNFTLAANSFDISKAEKRIAERGILDRASTYMFDNFDEQQDYLSCLLSGDSRCLRLFPTIRQMSDAGWSWELDGSIAYALSANAPGAIDAIHNFELSGPSFYKDGNYAASVCRQTREEWSEDETDKNKLVESALSELQKRLALIEAIKEQDKTLTKTKCIDAINDSMGFWREYPNR